MDQMVAVGTCRNALGGGFGFKKKKKFTVKKKKKISSPPPPFLQPQSNWALLEGGDTRGDRQGQVPHGDGCVLGCPRRAGAGGGVAGATMDPKIGDTPCMANTAPQCHPKAARVVPIPPATPSPHQLLSLVST